MAQAMRVGCGIGTSARSDAEGATHLRRLHRRQSAGLLDEEADVIEKPMLLIAGCALAALLGACAQTPAAPSAPQAAPAAASSTAPAPVQTAATDKSQTEAPKPHKTCQTDYQVGSHISTNTVCMTDDEEDRLHEQEEEQMDAMKNITGSGLGGSSH